MEKMGFEETIDIISEKLKKRETERLRKREAERQLSLERRREEREQVAASNEQVNYFADTFNEKRIEIEDALSAAPTVEKSQLPHHFDKVVKNIQSLQNFISASTYFLRVYDIRKSQEALQVLQQRCQELEDQLIPKKKFGFKAKKSANKCKKENYSYKIEDCVDSSAVSMNSKPISLAENTCGFSQRIGERLTLSHEVTFKKDVVLSKLEDCTVFLMGAASTMHITNVRNCRIVCGPVTTSIFIDDCIDCSLMLACQQMRIHNTRHCNFYLHVTSRVIIEDTKEVAFAPYSWKYEDIDLHFKLAGLDMNRNNWDYVDDFNWLAVDKPSPHWRILKENERKTDWA